MGEPRRRRGLRLRIAVLAAGLTALALTAGAVLLLTVLRRRLDADATAAAESRGDDVAALAVGGVLPRLLSLPGEGAAIVQVVTADGAVIAATRNVEQGVELLDVLPPPARGSVISTARIGEHGERFRIAARTVAVEGGGVVTVIAGEPLTRDDRTIDDVAALLLAGLPAVIVVVGGIAWWIVGRTLRPVAAITRTMQTITANDLSGRVPTGRADDEIGHLAATVNDTLHRLEESVGRQRRFVADASHELRGPLASLRADLEISVAHPDRTDWRALAEASLGDVDRLQSLTSGLLTLARLDADVSEARVVTDLTDLAERVVARHRNHRMTIDIDAPGALYVRVVARQLDQLVDNLVANAVRHATGHCKVTLHMSDGVVFFAVGDDGPGIAMIDRQRVFERFVRLDDARTRDAGGTGLGLSIVRDIAASHDGTVAIDTAPLGGARFTVALPAVAAPTGSARKAVSSSDLQPASASVNHDGRTLTPSPDAIALTSSL